MVYRPHPITAEQKRRDSQRGQVTAIANRLAETHAAILSVIAATPGGCTARRITAKTGYSKSAVARALIRLTATGDVVATLNRFDTRIPLYHLGTSGVTASLTSNRDRILSWLRATASTYKGQPGAPARRIATVMGLPAKGTRRLLTDLVRCGAVTATQCATDHRVTLYRPAEMPAVRAPGPTD
jgi:DNA-binding IclR family transcriptional regulator